MYIWLACQIGLNRPFYVWISMYRINNFQIISLG